MILCLFAFSKAMPLLSNNVVQSPNSPILAKVHQCASVAHWKRHNDLSALIYGASAQLSFCEFFSYYLFICIVCLPTINKTNKQFYQIEHTLWPPPRRTNSWVGLSLALVRMQETLLQRPQNKTYMILRYSALQGGAVGSCGKPYRSERIAKPCLFVVIEWTHARTTDIIDFLIINVF